MVGFQTQLHSVSQLVLQRDLARHSILNLYQGECQQSSEK